MARSTNQEDALQLVQNALATFNRIAAQSLQQAQLAVVLGLTLSAKQEQQQAYLQAEFAAKPVPDKAATVYQMRESGAFPSNADVAQYVGMSEQRVGELYRLHRARLGQ